MYHTAYYKHGEFSMNNFGEGIIYIYTRIQEDSGGRKTSSIIIHEKEREKDHLQCSLF